MEHKEVMILIKQLRSQFKASKMFKDEEDIDKNILDMFFQAYCEDKMDREDLVNLTNAMGYDVNEDVLDQIEKEKGNQ